VSALADALHERLSAQGLVVRQLVPGAFTRPVDGWRFEVDFSSPDALQPLAGLLAADDEPVGALIDLMGHDALADHRNDARALFLLLKLLGPDLKRSAAAGGGRLVNLTAFDGRFGLRGPSVLAAGSAGTLGVAKSAAREWGQVRVKCIDAAPGLAPEWLAEQIAGELFGTDPEVEIGFSAEGRCRLGLAPRCIERAGLAGLALDPDAVVLVTGGAYGITAELTRMLAEKYRPRLVLIGRSALPGEEGELTRGIDDSAELRRRLTAELKATQGKVKPVQVEAALNTVLKERQIRANLAAMRESASVLEYHCLDVRDSAALAALIDDVYARLGRIDGVLHGAGVISDKLIASKPLDAFDAVYDTKVVPALVLAAKLRLPELRFIAFFSSVAGRFGNIGQADYSAANEVLNKLAGQLSHAWPKLHALAINWGPWDAGMVNEDLRRLYAARDIRPIAPATGRRHFMEALEQGPQRQAEIVISSSIDRIAALRLAH
jgi:NAD(P)-dependent dehydrogenase (short-subunit alcohol dehydrogenase family)